MESHSTPGALAVEADTLDKIKISMLYKGIQEGGNIIYPKENREGIQAIVDTLNSATPTQLKSVNEVPTYDRLIKIELIPDKTVYLYQDSGKYYLEIPYVGIGEITRDAYEQILGAFGPIRPFPEELDKSSFC